MKTTTKDGQEKRDLGVQRSDLKRRDGRFTSVTGRPARPIKPKVLKLPALDAYAPMLNAVVPLTAESPSAQAFKRLQEIMKIKEKAAKIAGEIIKEDSDNAFQEKLDEEISLNWDLLKNTKDRKELRIILGAYIKKHAIPTDALTPFGEQCQRENTQHNQGL